MITFNKDLFTRIFWQLREAKGKTRFLINYGGAGSSKSFSQAQHEIINAMEGPEKVLVIRKVQATLKDSCIDLISSILNEWGLLSSWKFHGTEQSFKFSNGSKIIFRGLDDPEKIKSIHGVTRVWIEEANQISEKDWDLINLRIRGIDDIQFCLTFNPVSEHHWLKKRFFDTEGVDSIAIHSTYKDNPWLDQAFIDQLKWYEDHDYDYFRVYGLGEWGKLRTGNEFYRKFDGKNIGEVKYDPELPLHITFDFNVNPYMTLLILQVKKKELRIIDEITPKHPKNNTEDTAKLFLEKYGEHNAGVSLYGDPSGKSEDTRQKSGHNDYSQVKRVLKDLEPIDKVLPKAPPVAQRGNFINALLSGWDGWKIYINKSCVATIDDLRFVKQDLDGSKVKTKEKDKETGVSYELYGHASDALDYFITSAMKSEWRKYSRGSKTSTFVTGNRKAAY